MEKERELASLSGNEPAGLTFRFTVGDPTQVGEARRFAARLCSQLNLSSEDSSRAAIVVNELGNNLARYAPGGELLIRKMVHESYRGLEVLSVDKGPGIANLERSLTDGFSTGTTPGTGLGAVKRQADVFDIYSRPGHGTLIVTQIVVGAKQDNHRLGAVSIPYTGETVCGDGWTVEGRGTQIAALMADGLGHGVYAHKAASAAISAFHKDPFGGLEMQITRIHQNLKSTRGAAIFVVCADLNRNNIAFAGVGNIRTFLSGNGTVKTLISNNGTAGVQIRTPHAMNEPWPSRALLILHSDGLSNRAHLGDFPGIENHHPALAAAALYRDFNRGTDDVSVVAIGVAP